MTLLKTFGVLAILVGTAVGAWALARATADPVVEAGPGPAVLAVPVEMRVLETAIVDRGIVEHADRVAVPLLGLTEGAVVTWSPPPGARIDAGAVLAEVSGRPVFALPGATPMYRALERGRAGRDVVQLQEALVALGLREDPPTGTFDHGDEHAAAVLYLGAGYEPEARAIPARAGRLAGRWRALTGGALECPDPCEGEVAALRDELVRIYGGLRVRIPAGEVVFVEGLPRRVGSAPAAGTTAMELTSEALQARVTMGGTRVGALEVGMAAAVDVDDGLGAAGQIAGIRLGTGEEAGLWVVTILLDDAVPELVGQVARVRIPLVSSEEPVLAVPLSALATNADGSTSVTVQEPDGSTRRVGVTAGLIADGFVEVRPSDGELSNADYVVVGQRGG